MIGIMAARQAYRKLEIDAIGLVREEDNPADGLSRANNNGALQKQFVKEKDTTKVAQLIEGNGASLQIPPHWKGVGV